MANFKNSDTFVRELELLNDIVLNIHQLEVGDVGCVVWDAAIVLAKYLETNDFDLGKGLMGKRVLELGAGTGVVGLAAAVHGADVVITDLPDFVPLMNTNIQENKNKLTGSIIARTLVWGEDVAPGNYDIVLLADCIYYEQIEFIEIYLTSLEQSLDPLVKSVIQHCNKDTNVFCCYEQRTMGNKPQLEQKFNQLMEEKCIPEVIPLERQHGHFHSEDILIKKFKLKPD